MKLLTAALRAQLPALYSQEHSQDPTVHLKFFTPGSNWTWFATEASPDEDSENDLRFFGYVIGLEEEWGYFMLSELESARGSMGLPIERDRYFEPGPFSEVIQQYRRDRGQIEMPQAILQLTLKDTITDATVQATIEADEHGINVGFLGYGDYSSADGFGRPVLIELHNGQLTIHVWTDIRQEDATHLLSLEHARENRRICR